MLVFCPYASRAPFETMILPKRQHAHFPTATVEEVARLADALQATLRRVNAALAFPAYSMVLSTAPVRHSRRDYWNTIEQDFRWHVELVPRLYPSTGFDLATGCTINPVCPRPPPRRYGRRARKGRFYGSMGRSSHLWDQWEMCCFSRASHKSHGPIRPFGPINPINAAATSRHPSRWK